ncbi:NfeD family protein [Kaistia geumhonensis]|uniref:Membrane protein implicated in regulation of membrane protease activity n=1 Tax=Kaistia geumhonensis TaxID=410839 RepID=A0ABU0M9M0_9HYPH|nr:NfeD family protein [Kaistia geumhonensis]MCX5480828.1 NfeD family protein [Kaistia geumhonensis]MDQ0517468.1 membrane protein implicated in regulation of membrane protease activity [Kaistia geumhonensis]
MNLDFVAGPWGWIVAGLVLLGLELFAPGAFLMWLGLAAVVVGLATLAVDLPWQVAAVLFVVLASIFVLIGRRIAVRRATAEDDLRLNDRAARLVGLTFPLADAIEGGRGRIRVDDSSWGVEGPDLPAGTTIRVVGHDGARLKVVAA